MIFFLGDCVGIERIGFDNIGTCFYVRLVYGLNDFRFCQVQYVVVTFQIYRVSDKTLSSEIFFSQSEFLNSRACGSV